jgi:tRNA (cytidine/uridine-2'-O-)-methyltransferase
MFHIVLFQPEIPPNTGNVVRLAANTGSRLHIVEPMAFALSEKQVRRAGMDYAEVVNIVMHKNWAACRDWFVAEAQAQGKEPRLFAMTTKGSQAQHNFQYQAGDVFIFGPETRGLPTEVLAEFAPDRRIRLPMVPGNRSINLSNAVAITVFEAWRQVGYQGGE